MRTLHADLTAAQKARSRTPFLQAVVKDRFAGLRRLRFTSWYSGSEADEGNAALAWVDGGTRYLFRVRFDGTTLYRSLVTNPTSSSTFSSWVSFTPNVVAGIVTCAKAGSTLWTFVIPTSATKSVFASTSTDNGATWSSFSSQFTDANDILHMGAAGKSNGDVVVAISIAAAEVMSAYHYTGSWSTGFGSGDLQIVPTGIDLVHGGDWNIIVTGKHDTDDERAVKRILFGDGFDQASETWGSPLTIVKASDEADIDYTHPAVYHPDVDRLAFRQAHTSAVTYDRVYQSRLPATSGFNADHWREPVPFDLLAPLGVALTEDDTNVYMTTARRVFSAPLSEDTLDVTADVISADLHDIPLNPRLSEIVLDNADRKYQTPGSGSVVAVTKGAEVEISPGYRTVSGNRVSAGPSYHIVGWEHSYEKGRATFKLLLGSVWTHLARHRFQRAVVFAESAAAVATQFQFVLTRVGSWEVSGVSASSESSNLQPPLAIPPGVSALTAARRIMDRVPDALIVREEFVFMTEPLAGDAADAAYSRPIGSDDMEISEALYRDLIKDANHIQVFAEDDASIVADLPDFAETDLLYSAPRQRHDPFLDTGSEATARADAEARDQLIATRSDRLIAPVHTGLETNDVLDIDDQNAKVSPFLGRVLSLQLIYRRGTGSRARYDHIITLGER